MPDVSILIDELLRQTLREKEAKKKKEKTRRGKK